MLIREKLNKVVLLNLPNAEKITKRYMCSYASPNSLFPPYELLSAASILRERLGKNVQLIDAIAEKKPLKEVVKQLNSIQPDAIITLAGFECFQEDMELINSIKTYVKNSKIIVLGHYPTLFPKETLMASEADYILHGEPDNSIVELFASLEEGQDLSSIDGLSYFANGEFFTRSSKGRITDIDSFPVPAFDLLSSNTYAEPLLPKPFGVVQSARGCPYQCNFCVKSFGSLLTEKSPENIVAEIKSLVQHHNIKSFRFTDDTFTLNHKRVIKICQLLVEEKLSYLEWTCLGRVENVKEEMISWMRKAGCKRIYFGLESGSPKILKILNKNTNIEKAVESLLLVNDYGIQTAGFFMLGIPGETKEDVDLSIDMAIRSKLKFLSIGKFTPYPGTPFYSQFNEEIEFNIYPYKLEFTGKSMDKYSEYEKYFYKKFYLRMPYFADQLKLAISKPKDSMYYFTNFLSYSFFNGNNGHIHIQKAEV